MNRHDALVIGLAGMAAVSPVVKREEHVDNPEVHQERAEEPRAMGGFAIQWQSTASAFNPHFVFTNQPRDASPSTSGALQPSATRFSTGGFTLE